MRKNQLTKLQKALCAQVQNKTAGDSSSGSLTSVGFSLAALASYHGDDQRKNTILLLVRFGNKS